LEFISIGVFKIAGHEAMEGSEQYVAFKNGGRVAREVS